jgi:hypothetical protein
MDGLADGLGASRLPERRAVLQLDQAAQFFLSRYQDAGNVREWIYGPIFTR